MADKFTILKSGGGVPTLSLEKASEELQTIVESVQDADGKLKTFSLEQLLQIKQQTAAILDEFKELEQTCESAKKAVQELDGKIEGDASRHQELQSYV